MTDPRQLFPMVAGGRVYHLATFSIEAFPPHRWGLVMLVAPRGQLTRPELLTMPANSLEEPRQWLMKNADCSQAEAEELVAAAKAMETFYMEQARDA